MRTITIIKNVKITRFLSSGILKVLVKAEIIAWIDSGTARSCYFSAGADAGLAAFDRLQIPDGCCRQSELSDLYVLCHWSSHGRNSRRNPAAWSDGGSPDAVSLCEDSSLGFLRLSHGHFHAAKPVDF